MQSVRAKALFLPEWRSLSARLAGKKSEDNLFDLIDPTKVNKHLQELMPGLTIKVFRTYNASITLSRLLKDTDEDLDVPGKKAQVRSCAAFR